jgi:hypothetical protein
MCHTRENGYPPSSTKWIPAFADAVRLFMLNKKRLKKQEDEVNWDEKKRGSRNEV